MLDLSHQRIKRLFSPVYEIGEPSSEGYVMTTSDDKFILKAPKQPHIAPVIEHELFVGLNGTNKIRDVVPNFVYVFGGFSCTPPVIGSGGEVVSYCEDKGQEVPYIIYENLRGSLTLDEFIREKMSPPNEEDIFSLIIQVVAALKEAWNLNRFTHNDLHPRNVLIKQLDREYSIPYGDNFYLTTDIIAMFIDYAEAHIDYKNKSYGYVMGKNLYEGVGVFSDLPLPILDVYKFIFSLLAILAVYYPSIYQEVKPIIEYFYPDYWKREEYYDNYIKDNIGSRFDYISLPTQKEREIFKEYIETGDTLEEVPIEWRITREYSHDDFLDYLLSLKDFSFLSLEPQLELLPQEEINWETQLEEEDIIYSVSQTEEEFISNYSQVKIEYIREIQEGIQEIEDKISLLPDWKAVRLKGVLFPNIIKYAKDYQDYFSQVARVYSLIKEQLYQVEIGYDIAEMYDDLFAGEEYTSLEKISDNFKTQLLKLQERIEPYIKSIREDKKYFLNLMKNERISNFFTERNDRRRKTAWLRGYFPLLVDIF